LRVRVADLEQGLSLLRRWGAPPELAGPPRRLRRASPCDSLPARPRRPVTGDVVLLGRPVTGDCRCRCRGRDCRPVLGRIGQRIQRLCEIKGRQCERGRRHKPTERRRVAPQATRRGSTTVLTRMVVVFAVSENAWSVRAVRAIPATNRQQTIERHKRRGRSIELQRRVPRAQRSGHAAPRSETLRALRSFVRITTAGLASEASGTRRTTHRDATGATSNHSDHASHTSTPSPPMQFPITTSPRIPHILKMASIPSISGRRRSRLLRHLPRDRPGRWPGSRRGL